MIIDPNKLTEADHEYISAVHEFGHALAAIILGIPIQGVMVATKDVAWAWDDGMGGGAALVATLDDVVEDWKERGFTISRQNLSARQAKLVCTMCGVCAEAVVFGPDHKPWGHENDWEKINELAESEEEKNQLYAYGLELCEFYEDILHVGARLLRENVYLSGSELADIVHVLRQEQAEAKK
jgi:hypothetical protein